MPTNKLVVRSTDEFMSGYEPSYVPIYPLLMSNGKSKAYSEFVGTHNWRQLTAVGDLRAKHITPKDTEIQQITVTEGTKAFKKYFRANQYTQSKLQEAEDIDGIVAQVLDEHQKQFDEITLMGDQALTASDNTGVINNGLYWSKDPNYTLNSSAAISASPNDLTSFYNLLMSNLEDASNIGGRKAIIVYGATAIGKLNGLMSDGATTLRNLIANNSDGDESIIKLPKEITPASANGWMIVSLDAIKFHYVTLPKLDDQGVNAEKMYSWHNFLMGASMVEVEKANGIIRQPVTFS